MLGKETNLEFLDVCNEVAIKRTAIFEGKGSLTTARFLYQRVLDFAHVRYCSAAPNTRRNTTYLTCSLVNDQNDSTHHVTPYSVFFATSSYSLSDTSKHACQHLVLQHPPSKFSLKWQTKYQFLVVHMTNLGFYRTYEVKYVIASNNFRNSLV